MDCCQAIDRVQMEDGGGGGGEVLDHQQPDRPPLDGEGLPTETKIYTVCLQQVNIW